MSRSRIPVEGVLLSIACMRRELGKRRTPVTTKCRSVISDPSKWKKFMSSAVLPDRRALKSTRLGL